MALTIGGIILLAGLIFLIYYGFGFAGRRSVTARENLTRKCALCKRDFPQAELIERQVGDTQLLYFCKPCIENLWGEVISRPASS
jgi:hypothetical protein